MSERRERDTITRRNLSTLLMPVENTVAAAVVVVEVVEVFSSGEKEEGKKNGTHKLLPNEERRRRREGGSRSSRSKLEKSSAAKISLSPFPHSSCLSVSFQYLLLHELLLQLQYGAGGETEQKCCSTVNQ